MIKYNNLIENKFIALLILLIIYFMAKAFAFGVFYDYVISLSLLLLIVVSLYSFKKSKHILYFFALISGVSVIVSTISGNILDDSKTLFIVRTCLGIIFFWTITLISLIYTFRESNITINNICGAACTYLFLGIAWTNIYVLIVLMSPQAFNIELAHLNYNSLVELFTYYSFVTLTTLGFGEIVPISDVAHTFSWLEAITGQLYLTVLVAQLIGIYISKKSN